MNRSVRIAAALGACVGASVSTGQSLFLQQQPIRLAGDNQIDPHAELRSTSMFFVQPPEPRQFQRHDIIYVIINEVSRANSSQSLETTKEVDLSGTFDGAVDIWKLLATRLHPGDSTDVTLLDISADKEFAGEGTYDRSDTLSARLAATVLDVKPNGTLVLEARKSIGTDDERRTFLLTGLARQEDVTASNTLLSSQLADLSLTVINEGELRKSAKKGIITRALETLFAF